MLYMIGIGLCDEKDITYKGLEIVKKCSSVYLESYTSKLAVDVDKLSSFYGKEIVVADRDLVEKQASEILDKAVDNDVVFLVIGDVFSATTHTDLFLRAKEVGVEVKVINNASILTAVGITGLQLYKFGKTASITFDNSNLKTPIEILKGNLKINAHTLFLLDLDLENDKFFSIKEAIEYLERNGIDEKAIGCARIGCEDQKIVYGNFSDLKSVDFGKPPFCLIIHSELHFMEEDVLKQYFVTIK